ncbi:MAG: zf-HC2 domain-containing protein [Nocardioides sp.]
MTAHTWHADDTLLRAYVAGRLDAVTAASFEQHLTRCDSCRAAIRPHADVPALDRTWDGIRTSIESPRQPILVRGARRLGLGEPASVLLAATVSLRTAWVTSSLIALAFAVVAAHLSSDLKLWPFLLVAPLVPVLGVAAAYGSSDEPLESLVVTTPYGRGRLILTRTLAVLATTLPASLLVGLTLPGPAWVSAAWLGPALALVPVLLALASFVGPRVASGVVAVLWAGFVLPSVRPFPATWPVEPQQQVVHLVLALTAIAVLAIRARRTIQIGAVL